MSEKKSWDVQRKPSAHTARPASAPQRAPERAAPVRTPVKQVPHRTASAARPQAAPRTPERRATPVKVQSSPRRVAPQPLGALSKRRKQKRRTMRYVLLSILLLLIAAAFYALWLPSLRIQTISAEGPGADSAKEIVSLTISGSYFHIIPRNSIVFYSKEKIRTAIIDANPDVSAVSLTPTSFSSLHIRTTSRAESFIWCGTAFENPNTDGSCYQSDIEGFIFMQDAERVVTNTPMSTSTSSTTPHTATVSVSPAKQNVQSQIHVYGPLDRDVSGGQSPIRAHLALSSRIPEALKFVDAMRELGAPVTSLVIRGDEADLWIGKTTRITYVLGHEKDAALSAASAFPNLSLTDGTIQYIDLRFPGKVYLKKYGS
jgi:hypothetical protein